jgi:hypothetical protein
MNEVNTYQFGWKASLIAAVLFFFLTLLAGCSSQDKGDSHNSIEPGMTIIYKREGGIAGISQEWIIHLDGTIDGPGDQELVVPAEDVQDLAEKGMESDIESLAAETAHTETCCDQMTYILTITSGDQEWRLITTDTADQPKEVSELFIMVQALIAEAEPAS